MNSPQVTLKDIFAEAQNVITLASEISVSLATAESCTGGLIGAAITSIPGSSAIFKGGITAYDNSIKEKLLHIPSNLIVRHGAVSQEVARLMATGAIEGLNVDMAVSVTGIAGPGGGTEDKPIGTVWIGLAIRKDGNLDVKAKRHNFGDIGRNKIRDITCYEALRTITSSLKFEN